MKVRINNRIPTKRMLLLCLFVILAVFTVLICLSDNSIYKNFKSDQFGAFSTKSFPIKVGESPIAKTKFQLSDKVLISKSNNETGIASIEMYNQSYGTYPIITTELDATRLTTAFAMSILDMDYETAKTFTTKDKTIMPYLVKYHVDRAITFDVTKDTSNKLCQTKLICNNVSADLSIISDSLPELIEWSKKEGKAIIYNAFATDAIVVFTSIENPVNSITKEQLKAIYEGKIKNWKKLSGENKKIKKFDRCIYSAAQRAFDAYVLGNIVSNNSWNEILNTSDKADDREEYVNSSNSIGYALKSQFDLTYAKDKSIKILKINNISPTEENILSGKYAFAVPYYYAYKSDDKLSIGGQFADWIETAEGEMCIKAVGLIPLK